MTLLVLCSSVLLCSNPAPTLDTGDTVGAAADVMSLPLDFGMLSENVGSPSFGAADSWRWNLWGGYAYDFEDANQVHVGGGVSWFFVKDLSLDLEVNALGFDQEGEDALGANFNLLFRWHFISEEKWSLYADVGAGILGTSNDVPENGSSFNFTPQAGGGVSFEVAPDIRVLTGARWHHISNARTYHENPGRDSLMLYAGVSFPF